MCCTCRITLRRSSGAVEVRETAPASAPASKCRHQRPVSISVCVKSSGTFRSSPMSRYCGDQEKNRHEWSLHRGSNLRRVSSENWIVPRNSLAFRFNNEKRKSESDSRMTRSGITPRINIACVVRFSEILRLNWSCDQWWHGNQKREVKTPSLALNFCDLAKSVGLSL